MIEPLAKCDPRTHSASSKSVPLTCLATGAKSRKRHSGEADRGGDK